MKEVGKRIKHYREARGLSLRELAKRVDLTHGYLSHIESGKRKPNIEVLEKIANALDINLINLFGEEQTIPEELAEIGVEWIAFSKEMQEKGLTPEDIKNIINVIQSLNKNN